MLEKLTLSTVNPAREERSLRLVLLCTGKQIFCTEQDLNQQLTKQWGSTKAAPQQCCSHGGKAVVQDWGAASGLRIEFCLAKSGNLCLMTTANSSEQPSTSSRLGIPTLTRGDSLRNFSSSGRSCRGVRDVRKVLREDPHKR